MKRWGLNMLCLFIAVMSGVGMFMLKYKVIEKEEELARLHRQIAFDKREIHMLKGDWASLNDPERLRALVSEQTNFKPVSASQIIDVQRVPMRQNVSVISVDEKRD
ncbi:MAG: hypothetical protein IKV03_05305 [Alphaproteobacteria bacterium]|nr:hypothetical protein [Alphaproteobacteria bacterium]